MKGAKLYDTDIRFAVENDMHAALVLTGVTTTAQFARIDNINQQQPPPPPAAASTNVGHASCWILGGFVTWSTKLLDYNTQECKIRACPQPREKRVNLLCS